LGIFIAATNQITLLTHTCPGPGSVSGCQLRARAVVESRPGSIGSRRAARSMRDIQEPRRPPW